MPRLNPSLRKSHPGFIEGLIDIVNNFTTEGSVALEDKYIPMFRIFYDEFLRYLKDCDGIFYGSSYARKNYFWHKDNSTEWETQKYVQGNGKMKRIFFIDSLEGKPDHEEKEIIKRHFEIYGNDSMKGEVFICNSRQIPRTLHNIFCTETTTQVSWILRTNPGKYIERFQIETDVKKHNDFVTSFNDIVSIKTATTKVTQSLIQSWDESS
ncbi:MAG: hypothetical protein AAFN10_09980 [Bacteroidota bacterium]